MNLNNIYNFLAYMNLPLNDEEITLMYRANNVNYERCYLYYDFLNTFFSLISETYLGEEFIKGDQEKKHFDWCLNTVVENFKKENINFKFKDEFKDLSFTYVKEIFYDERDKELYGDKMVKFWNHIFKYDGMKTKSDMDAFVEMYRIMDASLLSR